jgi:hypothetical protein
MRAFPLTARAAHGISLSVMQRSAVSSLLSSSTASVPPREPSTQVDLAGQLQRS